MTDPDTSIGPATEAERERAFRLMLRHCPEEALPQRLAAAVAMIDQGELDPEGLLVLRQGGQVVAAAAAAVVPGGSGIVWPPCAEVGPASRAGPADGAARLAAPTPVGPASRAGPADGAARLAAPTPPVPLGSRHLLFEDQLAKAQLEWLRERGARLAQADLPPDEAFLSAPLLRAGYRHITTLWYLRHDREMSVNLLDVSTRLRWQTFAEADRAVFLSTLERSLEQTLDCPELAHCRSMEDIVIGYQAQGAFDAGGWWLAHHDGEPVGVLLTCAVPERASWEVCYVGVVPEQRRRGFGREMIVKAILEARAAEVLEIFLTVDARNRPAWDMYRALGFEPFDCREVFLYLW